MRDAELGGSSRGDGVSVDLGVCEGDGEGVSGEADGVVDGVAVCGVCGEVSVGGGVLFAVYAVFGGGGAGVDGGGSPEKGEGFGGEVGGDGAGDDGGVGGLGGGLREGVGGQGKEAGEEESQGWDGGFHAWGGIIRNFSGRVGFFWGGRSGLVPVGG